jgi:hypothetical protein
MAHRKGTGFTWALDPGRQALENSGALEFKKAAESLEDRPVTEQADVMGKSNYSEFGMYKNDMRTHSRTLYGPSDIHKLPRTQSQEIGFYTQRRKAFVPANGCGACHPENSPLLLLPAYRHVPLGFHAPQHRLPRLASASCSCLWCARGRGPYYPRNASQETKIADALARDFAK